MGDKIVFLDLNKVDLYGFEHGVNDLYIDEMINSILEDVEFPPVSVLKINNSTYHLVKLPDPKNPDRIDAGHHRSVAHYICSEPLKCRLVTLKERLLYAFPILKKERIYIGDIELYDGSGFEGLTDDDIGMF